MKETKDYTVQQVVNTLKSILIESGRCTRQQQRSINRLKFSVPELLRLIHDILQADSNEIRKLKLRVEELEQEKEMYTSPNLFPIPQSARDKIRREYEDKSRKW